MIKYDIRKNAYYDSVTLMLISKEIKNIDGVTEALVGMGTELNKELTGNLNLMTDRLSEISANDFYIAANVESEEIMTLVITTVEELLTKKKVESGSEYQPVSLKSALEFQPDANMVVVSIPGKYAEEEVHKLLDNNLNVMLFSDNVSIEAELKLKQKAVEKGLLMMGPDCGTSIINGIPLAFANVVRKGNIGIVGASGTGIQEVTCLIDKMGAGVSQVIGTGGRDLKSEIGGLMMIQGMEALMADEATDVIVLISKPPAPEVAEKILKLTKKTKKAIVVDFIGRDPSIIRSVGAYPCTTLEDAALKAVALSKGKEPEEFDGFTLDNDVIENILKTALSKIGPEQKYLRGLYTGGTLADEAMKMLGHTFGGIYSNIPLEAKYELNSLTELTGHVCLDLGEDQFTVGRPHPMIDPSTRSDRFVTDIDDEVAVVLVDVVLGYGSHLDPAGEVATSIGFIKKSFAKKNKDVFVVASITGTIGDPQGLAESTQTLEDAGIVVMPSNAQAVRLVKAFMNKLSGGRNE